MSRFSLPIFALGFLTMMSSFLTCDGAVQRQRIALGNDAQNSNHHLSRTQNKVDVLSHNSRTVVKSALNVRNPANPRQNRRALVTKPGATVPAGVPVSTHATTIPAPYNGGQTPAPTVTRIIRTVASTTAQTPSTTKATASAGSTAITATNTAAAATTTTKSATTTAQNGGTVTVTAPAGSTTKAATTTAAAATTTASGGTTTGTTVSTVGTSTVKSTATTTARNCDGGTADSGDTCSSTICCRYGQPCAADATGTMVCGTSNGCTQGNGQTCDPNIFTNGGASCCAVDWTCGTGADGVTTSCF